MVAGSFGVVTLVGDRGDVRHYVDDYRGLARSEPVLALSFAKFYVLRGRRCSWPLGLVAMLSAVIAAFLYLRIIVSMYMGGEEEEADTEAEAEAVVPVTGPRIPVRIAARIGLAVAVLFTIVVGVLPRGLPACPTTPRSRYPTPRRRPKPRRDLRLLCGCLLRIARRTVGTIWPMAG